MDLPVEFDCPVCGAPIRTDRQDLTEEGELVCPGCGRRVALVAGQGPVVVDGQEGASAPPPHPV